MSGDWNRSLVRQMADAEFRHAYVKEDVRTGLAFQIRALREARNLSQADLGLRAGKAQSAIARMEDPDYGRFTLKSLLDVAQALDVALSVRFTSFDDLLARNSDLSPEALAVPSFYDGVAASAPRGEALSQVNQQRSRGNVFILKDHQKDPQASPQVCASSAHYQKLTAVEHLTGIYSTSRAKEGTSTWIQRAS